MTFPSEVPEKICIGCRSSAVLRFGRVFSQNEELLRIWVWPELAWVMYRKSERSLIWCRLLDINLCLASQKRAQGQLLLCLLWLQGLWHNQISSLVFFGESREVEVCARERPQEPDFPLGSRVRTSLGDPDVQCPFCNHNYFFCWGGRLWTVV